MTVSLLRRNTHLLSRTHGSHSLYLLSMMALLAVSLLISWLCGSAYNGLFCCPEQLYTWPCQSVGLLVSQLVCQTVWRLVEIVTLVDLYWLLLTITDHCWATMTFHDLPLMLWLNYYISTYRPLYWPTNPISDLPQWVQILKNYCKM